MLACARRIRNVIRICWWKDTLSLSSKRFYDKPRAIWSQLTCSFQRQKNCFFSLILFWHCLTVWCRLCFFCLYSFAACPPFTPCESNNFALAFRSIWREKSVNNVPVFKILLISLPKGTSGSSPTTVPFQTALMKTQLQYKRGTTSHWTRETSYSNRKKLIINNSKHISVWRRPLPI